MENKTKKCLVTGSTGVVGVPLVLELLKQGHQVKVLVRNVVNFFPAEVEQIVGDLLDEKSLQVATQNCDWIFHLAAKLHMNNPTENLANEYREINIEATRKLLEFSKNAEKFIFFSTINVYGESINSKIFDETDELKPSGIYAESKYAAEKEVLLQKNGIVLRLAAVYGSRMKGNYLSVLSLIRKGIFVFIGKGENRRTLIHHHDVARAAVFIAKNEKTSGQIYNVSDNKVHSFRDIVENISKVSGKDSPKIQIPVFVARFAFNIIDKFSSVSGKKLPISSELLNKLLEDMAVSSDKLKNLGFEPEFDLENGWREVIGK